MGCQCSSVRGQLVNTIGFVSHVTYMAIPQLCHYIQATDIRNVCVPIKLYSQRQVLLGLQAMLCKATPLVKST